MLSLENVTKVARLLVPLACSAYGRPAVTGVIAQGGTTNLGHPLF